MMMRVATESGSIYEIDYLNERVRRLSGTAEPTGRQGPDGEWKRYVSVVTFPTREMFFDWDGLGHGTLTSPVIGLVGDSAREGAEALDENLAAIREAEVEQWTAECERRERRESE